MKKALYSGIAILFLMLFIGFSVTGNYSIVNKSGVNVTGVTIIPTGNNTDNSVNFSTSISKDQSISVDFTVNSENCSYDIRFKDDQGREYVMSGIDLCGSTELVLVSNKADEVPQIYVPKR